VVWDGSFKKFLIKFGTIKFEVAGDFGQNARQCSDFQRIMRRDGNVVVLSPK